MLCLKYFRRYILGCLSLVTGAAQCSHDCCLAILGQGCSSRRVVHPPFSVSGWSVSLCLPHLILLKSNFSFKNTTANGKPEMRCFLLLLVNKHLILTAKLILFHRNIKNTWNRINLRESCFFFFLELLRIHHCWSK